MRPRDSLVAWCDEDSWPNSYDGALHLESRTHTRLMIGYYLLVPVESEKAGLELAKRLSSASNERSDG